jgi:hypothetical protein
MTSDDYVKYTLETQQKGQGTFFGNRLWEGTCKRAWHRGFTYE